MMTQEQLDSFLEFRELFHERIAHICERYVEMWRKHHPSWPMQCDEIGSIKIDGEKLVIKFTHSHRYNKDVEFIETEIDALVSDGWEKRMVAWWNAERDRRQREVEHRVREAKEKKEREDHETYERLKKRYEINTSSTR